ncbi:Alpha/Beta hydrolase protein [Achaetomium macrosporum]|uniref:Alpha/Beta hydrolase protein n=1 Tax=Achaetomium macrosporum TaxID=79813 RepID=A0AAN7C7D7_9PEZI|nr:Alpha/Beta hydrolase protein [Achaetomium macrosporum]
MPIVDGIPALNLGNPQPEDVDTRPHETAHDAVGPAPSRFWLRMSAAWWRSLQYVGMTLHFQAHKRPPNPTFTKTIPSTISKVKGEFTLQFYTPEGYAVADKTGRKFPAVVNFHGGGFTIGNATDDARFARFVLEICHAVFVSVDYRLSPENPFPVAVEDAADALLYLIRSGPDLHIDPSKLAVSGFSAGGNLAITAPLRLADHVKSARASGMHIPDYRIRAVATWYPVTDYTRPRALKRANSVRPDQTLPQTFTSLFDASYLYPPSLSLSNPYLSPSKATDEQLAEAIPETVIFYTCEWDMLLEEGKEFARRLEREPISRDVRYKMVPGVPHAWDKSPNPNRPAELSEDLYSECCEYLREAFERE